MVIPFFVILSIVHVPTTPCTISSFSLPRLTGVYAFVVLLQSSLVGHLPSDPYAESAAEECRGTWWQNLLYVNNLPFLNKSYCIDQVIGDIGKRS